ncbi:hypothetical protein ACLB2K_064393 [Fragaria x ananassa]
MAASLTLIKRASLLPLPAKFRTLAPPPFPFPFHSPLPFSFISPNHYSSSPLSLDSYFSDNHTLRFSYDSEAFFASLINSSTHKTHLTQIHAQLLVLGFQASAFLITKLVNHSLNLGHITYARQVFDEFTDPGVFLWNAIVRGYSKHNAYADAVQMYCGMQEMGVGPDGFTFPHVLKACGGLGAVEMGRRVHGQVFRHGFESDVVVQNSLVAFYAKCGRADRARIVFDGLAERSIVSWTSIISGVLKAYTDVEGLGQGRSVHGCLVKMGLEFEPDLVISLTAMYAKSGQVMVARSLFDKMERPNVIMWNAIISGYAKNGHAEKAVELFREMISRSIRIDSITVRSAIVACAEVGSLELAKWMDGYICKNSARMVFDRTPNKDVVVWSAMFVGYGLHGRGREAIDLYHSMQQAGVVPNDVTFLGLLTACNHSGLVHEGWELFHRMRDYRIEPGNHHYSCVVDLLGRAGQLEQAYDFIKKMPIEPGTSVWGALLSSCKIHHNVTLGQYAAEKLLSLDPYEIGHYVQLSNLFASARLWDRVAQEKSHPRSEEIYEELESLERRLKEAGFVPHTESVLHDLNYEETEETLCNHSERLAIVYIECCEERCIRVHKAAVPVVTDLRQMYCQAEAGAIVALLSRLGDPL